MTVETESRVDEKATLDLLETRIAKRQQVATMRETVNQEYRRLNACATEESKATQQVDQLEGRVKSYHKQILLGATKPGELPLLKQQLLEAKEGLDRIRQALEERSASYSLGQETLTQLLTELGESDRQLRDDLSKLYMQRFHEHDSGLLGKRGQVSWKEDENSSERYARQWRGRVFNFLLFKGFASDMAENHLLHALLAFFRQTTFCVEVKSGFIPSSTRSKEPLSVGTVVTVPRQLSQQEAFEEIARRRVEFVTEGRIASVN